MIDKNGRNIDYVRISLTDRCNLRCIYCMPEEGIQQVHHEEILTYDEIERVCRSMADLGVKKIKLTGGEPLVRKNCAVLAEKLKSIDGIESVTLTTNGILLADQIDDLVKAGIDAVNISLDTMDPVLFQNITRRDEHARVLEGIRAALFYPELSVKLNCVPLGTEKSNYIELAELAKKHRLHVRFIEMMPIGFGKEYSALGEEAIRSILEEAYGPMKPSGESFGNGPCRYFALEGFQGKIGFISAMSHKFCSSCNRVRLTADGFLKGCLQYQAGCDLRSVLRDGSSEEQLTETIRGVIYEKPLEHRFHEAKLSYGENRIMSQIGG